MNQPQFTDLIGKMIYGSSYDTERQKVHIKTKLLKMKIIKIFKAQWIVFSTENDTTTNFQNQFANAAAEFLRQFCILKKIQNITVFDGYTKDEDMGQTWFFSSLW